MKKTTFKAKEEKIINAITAGLEAEGTKTVGLEETIAKIAKGYMLVVQCVWYRIPNDKKVKALLDTYEDITKVAIKLLEKYNFEDLVYTYRKNYTNLYEVKKGETREYHLSKKDYEEFINNVNNDNLSVLPKPQAKKATKKAKRNTQDKDKNTQTKNSMTSFIYQVSKDKPIKKMNTKEYNSFMENLKETNDKAKEENSKKTTSKKSKKAKKGWVEHDHSAYLEEKTFIKAKMNDNSNMFVRFLQMNDNGTMNVNDHGTIKDIDIKDIKQVYTYQR